MTRRHTCLALLTVGVLSGPHEVCGQLLKGLSDIQQASSHMLKGLPLDKAKVSSSLQHVDPKKVESALKGADKIVGTIKLPEEQKPEVSNALKAVGDSLQQAVHSFNGTQEMAALEQLREGGEKTAVSVKTSLPDGVVTNIIGKVKGSKIAEMIKHTNPKDVEEVLEKDPHKIEEAIKTLDWWSGHWHLVLLTSVVVTVSSIAGCYLLRLARTKHPRSPNLLVDAEINMYVRSGGRRQPDTPSLEDSKFTQF